MKNSGPIRKKPWYDHAMPSGNSSLLHGFHILGHLGENPAQWQLEYREALAGYPKLLKQSPDGTGHAMAAQTEEAVGIVQIKGPLAMIRKIAGSMTHISHRPIFFTEEKEVSVLIKGKNLQLDREEAEEIVRQLTR